MTTCAKVIAVNGNMVSATFNVRARMNEVAYIVRKKGDEETRLKAEVIRIRDDRLDMQVFEDTGGIKIGDHVELSDELLSIELAPGLLGNVYDGLLNPLPKLAKKCGYFLKEGVYLDSVDKDKSYHFEPVVKKGAILKAGNAVGKVKESYFAHRIMIPFEITGDVEVLSVAEQGDLTVLDTVAKIKILSDGSTRDITMLQRWPIKTPIKAYKERLRPHQPLTTSVRIIDALFPIAKGGTACVPGPFGSGKTVLQQSVSRYADADVVIIAACGERAGEVVETLKEFPELNDPKTGGKLMERTIIICNTSSMPVAAREASVYTAMTLAEYYRQMGLSVLVLADSTSRWAQALREMSGRLEEIPGEEAFPAYLSSLIAAFYERAGLVRLSDPNMGESEGALTLIGTVSPAGGNFEEPVTQATLAVVGCFLGLTYARSYAKRFPAISPIDSWSKYLDSLKSKLDEIYGLGFVDTIKGLRAYYEQGQKIGDQMKVVGEEDLSLKEFIQYLKSEFFDASFLQQNAFDDVDAAPSISRVKESLRLVAKIINHDFGFTNKDDARATLLKVTNLVKEWNLTDEKCDGYSEVLSQIKAELAPQKTQTGVNHEQLSQ